MVSVVEGTVLEQAHLSPLASPGHPRFDVVLLVRRSTELLGRHVEHPENDSRSAEVCGRTRRPVTHLKLNPRPFSTSS